MKVAIILLVGLVLVSAYTESEYQTAFSSWMQTMQKSYTASEFQSRFNIFKKNMDYVRDWNAKNTQTVLGLTNMADLTNEEYRSIYLGTHIDGTASLAAAAMLPKKVTSVVSPMAPTKDANYTLTVDWVSQGAVTEIKNQGQCGSCWSFSTTGSTEGAHFLSGKTLVSLSEQNLMDCSTSYGNDGCQGGLMVDAFKYIIANQGIDTEDSYPYMGIEGTSCKYNAANNAATLSSYVSITAGSETDLETAATKQPVSVAIDASHESFQLYSSGIYYDFLCSQTKLDHGVLVVGYGADESSGDQLWKVKNSWGTTWGMDGYIYMSKDRKNNCGIATAASYPVV